jgi:hypothetical protein
MSELSPAVAFGGGRRYGPWSRRSHFFSFSYMLISRSGLISGSMLSSLNALMDVMLDILARHPQRLNKRLNLDKAYVPASGGLSLTRAEPCQPRTFSPGKRVFKPARTLYLAKTGL